MQFELILARQGRSLYGSHMGTLWANPYTLMMFNVTYITRSKPPKNTITYNITVNTLNALRVEPLKTSLA